MTKPRLPKGQRRALCGHFMQTWDTHSRCPGCRKKGKGQDPCVEGRKCGSCAVLTPAQLHLLRTSRTHDSRSPRRSRPSPETVPTRCHSPSRTRGRSPDRRRPQLTSSRSRHRSPVSRSPVKTRLVRQPPVSTGPPVRPSFTTIF